MSESSRAGAFAPDTALIVVDVQNDFAHPDGSLFVIGAPDTIEPLNAHIGAARRAGSTIVMTQDWHPPQTPHFVPDGGVWPVHCVRDTWGAALVDTLARDADVVLRKGTGGEDGYSAFTVADPETRADTSTGLAALLRARSITRVIVAGLAADVCVKATALDAQREGFETTVPWDLTRAVNLDPADGDRARVELVDAGVTVLDRLPS